MMYAIVLPFALYLIMAIWSHAYLFLKVVFSNQHTQVGIFFNNLAFIGIIATWVIFFV